MAKPVLEAADVAPDEDEAYVSAEDEDFDPNASGDDTDGSEAVAETSKAQDSGPSNLKSRSKASTTHAPARSNDGQFEAGAEDADFANSGDEATIRKGRKRRRKGSGSGHEDSGGEGGFVKTRSMRAEAQKEKAKRPLASTAGTTIDVDALWKSMNDATIRPGVRASSKPDTIGTQPSEMTATESKGPSESDMLQITHTYEFAGQTHTENKLVPRESAQAKLFLESKTKDAAQTETSAETVQKKGPEGQVLFRPLRRRSPWEPNPEGIVKGLPAWPGTTPAKANSGLKVVDKSALGWHMAPTKAPKLNVVNKSKLDWAKHVDQEGTREELEAAARAKGSFLDRRDFLERVEDRKEDQLRVARGK